MKSAKMMIVAVLGALIFGLISPTHLQAGPGKGKHKSKVKVKKHSPPLKAPAHGYRYKHKHGVDLTYDSGIGAYAVGGKLGVYFHNGLYIRLSKGTWKVTTHFNGTWRSSKDDEVPINLKKVKVAKPVGKAKVHPKKGKK
jgi:hypothetical protein